MFDREGYKSSLIKLFGDSITPEEIYRILSRLENAYKNLKSGDKVIHLSFHGELLNENELIEFKKRLTEAKFELSYIDESLVPKALYDTFDVPTLIFLNEFLGDLLKNGLLYPAIWEVIKHITKKAWDKTRRNNYQRQTSSTRKKIKSNTGIKVRLSKSKGLRFKINGDLSEETVDKSLDKIKDIVENYQRSNVPDDIYKEDTYRLTKKGKWRKVYRSDRTHKATNEKKRK
jgi:hypothetical protein